MGEVVPLIERVKADGDWTPVEREGLQALADQYSADRPDLEVVFGRTDQGDPWCVIKDLHDEILVHVARIASRFVLHSVANDDIAESDDLLEMLRSRIASLDLNLGKVLPFGRDGIVLTALVIVTALHWENHPPDERAPGADEAPQPDDSAQQIAAAGADLGDADSDPPVAASPHPSAGDVDIASGGGPAQAASASQASSAHLAALATAPSLDGDPFDAPPPPHAGSPAVAASDPTELVGALEGAEAATQLAAAGAASGQSGAASSAAGGSGGWEWMNGGDGDDRIELAANVVATGGQGADTFVVQTPAPSGSTEIAMLGVIADFTPSEGDRVVSDRGPVTTWTRDTPPVETPPDLPATLMSGQGYLVVDVDGDGRVDGYLILAQPANEAGAKAPNLGAPSPDQGLVYPLPNEAPADRSELPGMPLDATGLW